MFRRYPWVSLIAASMTVASVLFTQRWWLISSRVESEKLGSCFFFCLISFIKPLSVINRFALWNVSAPLISNRDIILTCYNKFICGFSAAFLASGYGYRPGVSGCFRHSVDGQELGHGGPTSQGPGWAVSQETTSKQSHFISLTSCKTHYSSWCNYFLFSHFLPCLSPPAPPVS